MRKLWVCLVVLVFAGYTSVQARTWNFGDEVQLDLLPNGSFEEPVLADGESYNPAEVSDLLDSFDRADSEDLGRMDMGDPGSDPNEGYLWVETSSTPASGDGIKLVGNKAVFNIYSFGGGVISSALLGDDEFGQPYSALNVDVSVDWTLDWTSTRNRNVSIRYRADPAVAWAGAGYGYFAQFDRYNDGNGGDGGVHKVILNYGTTQLANAEITIPGPAGTTTNNIRVVAVAGNHKVYLNDSLVLEYDDPVTSRQVSGSVGLRTGWSIAIFDNFVTNGVAAPLPGYTASEGAIVNDYTNAEFLTNYNAGQVVPDGDQVASIDNGSVARLVPSGEYVIEPGPISFLLKASIGAPLGSTSPEAFLAIDAVDGAGSTRLATVDVSSQLVAGEFVEVEMCIEVLADSAHIGKQLSVQLLGNEIDADDLQVYVANHPCEGCYLDITAEEGDLDDDCDVDLGDFAVMAGRWLDCSRYPECVTSW